MIFYVPQWQGSGTGKSILDGAEMIKSTIGGTIVGIPLSESPIDKVTNINGFTAIYEQLSQFKTALKNAQPETVKTIGGDCGLEIVPVSYLASKYKNLGVIWFDAHADINSPSESPSHNFHGMPLRTLLGESDSKLEELLFSKLKPRQIHYIGLRDIDETEQARIAKDHIYAPLTTNINHLIETMDKKGIENIYIHFDVDCLDPKSYSKTYYCVNNGLTIAQAESYLKALKNNFNVVGTSILESVATNDIELVPIKTILELLFDE
ncbi:arginase family protein [Winogradskyella maritima]|uniref:Arginase family protein n=1 Tax=Winogradskyella maritima TaxID=1517766 RepID=A0ABV8AHX2_9FLAO|nr:arginase family protein [Winogradskyella maritima]